MSCGLLTPFLLKTNYGHKVRKRVRIHSGYILVDVENNNIHSHNIEHAGARGVKTLYVSRLLWVRRP